MNPQVTSALTTLVVAALSSAGTWLVVKGVLTPDQANALAPELTAIVPVLGAIALGWWKSQQHTPTALVDAVNSAAVPGVKVVAQSSPSPAVDVDSAGTIKAAPPRPTPVTK